METRTCYICHDEKELSADNFYMDSTESKGLQWRCKKCDNKGRASRKPRSYNRKYSAVYYWKGRYGITKDEYFTLLEKQGGVCAICKKPPLPTEYLAVDHKHNGNKCQKTDIRGLLHRTCNIAIGCFKDNPAICRQAADYLEKPALAPVP